MEKEYLIEGNQSWISWIKKEYLADPIIREKIPDVKKEDLEDPIIIEKIADINLFNQIVLWVKKKNSSTKENMSIKKTKNKNDISHSFFN